MINNFRLRIGRKLYNKIKKIFNSLNRYGAYIVIVLLAIMVAIHMISTRMQFAFNVRNRGSRAVMGFVMAVSVFILAIDMRNRKRMEQNLIKKDRLLNGIAQAANMLLHTTNYKEALVEALNILGTTVSVDLAYIMKNHGSDDISEMYLDVQAMWTKLDIDITNGYGDTHKKLWKDMGISRWYDLLALGKSFSGLIKDFPEGERKYFRPLGVKAVLIMPIFVDELFWGIIGFEDHTRERKWSEIEKNTLTIAAANIGGVIKRMHTEEALKKALQDDFHKAVLNLQSYDSLTGLPNRFMVNEELSNFIKAAKDNNKMLAVLMLDLDRFKVINDTLGHSVGDTLLKQAAQILKHSSDKDHLIFRMGGDEFVVLIPEINNERDAGSTCRKIINIFRMPFIAEEHEIYITTSVGISIYPYDGSEAETLIKNADTAMYRAKERGGNSYHFYTNTMNEKALERLAMENSLRKAIEKEELFLVYQPKVDLNTGRIVGAEALARWNHPVKGIILPAEFIPMAEETGLIVSIGDWVLKTALTQAKLWQDKGYNDLYISANISPQQFQRGNLIKTIENMINEININPAFIDLEITESCLMENSDRNMDIVKSLKELGVDISVDDFGTGFSSLSYLKQFDVDVLKVDRSFIGDIPLDSNDMAITSAIISMAHDLNLKVIAEGVETEEQIKFLRSKNCDEIQGYYFSKPVSNAEFEKMLAEGKCIEISA